MPTCFDAFAFSIALAVLFYPTDRFILHLTSVKLQGVQNIKSETKVAFLSGLIQSSNFVMNGNEPLFAQVVFTLLQRLHVGGRNHKIAHN